MATEKTPLAFNHRSLENELPYTIPHIDTRSESEKLRNNRSNTGYQALINDDESPENSCISSVGLQRIVMFFVILAIPLIAMLTIPPGAFISFPLPVVSFYYCICFHLPFI